MATRIFQGRQVREIELLDVFPPTEGEITQYFGRIGQGKTYSATADILDLLRRGNVVYSNWRINWDGFDERESVPYLILGLIFPWRKRYYKFNKENLRYLPVDEHFHENFEKLTDCYVFLDEGHVVFDSYEMAKLSLARRASILHTRHFNRSICIISQRPTAIHVAMRANVNRFYKCEKRWQFGNIIRFRRTEFQDMINETVDDDEEKALSIKQYWGRAEVFNAYPSKYLRGETKASQKISFEAYDFGYVARLVQLFRAIFGRKVKLSTTISAIPTERSVQATPVGVKLEHVSKTENSVEHVSGNGKETSRPAINKVVRSKTRSAPQGRAKKKGVEIIRLERKQPILVKKIHVQHIRETMEKDKKNVALTNGEMVSRDTSLSSVVVKKTATLVALALLLFTGDTVFASSMYNAPYSTGYASTTSSTFTTSAEYTLGAWAYLPQAIFTDQSFRSTLVSIGQATLEFSSQDPPRMAGQFAVVAGTARCDFAGLNLNGYQNAWHYYSITATQSGGNVLGALWIDGVFRTYCSTAGTLTAPTLSNGVMIGRRVGGLLANVYYYMAGSLAGIQYVASPVSSSTNSYLDDCMLTQASSTITANWPLAGNLNAYGTGATAMTNFGLTSSTSQPNIPNCPIPVEVATSTPTTTTGTTKQEQIFLACVVIFFISLASWGKIWQRI